MRLASVGYYTSEYIRTNADEFVRYIQDQLTTRFSREKTSGDDEMQGLRINRDTIRGAVKDCYSIMKFDEAGIEFYDLDSTTAYSTSHSKYGSKSVASEIYNELSQLRQRTITNYESLSRMIEWLSNEDIYDPRDPAISEVIDFKRCAWNNYRIFNFYDSARLMAEASLKLQRIVDSS